MENQFSNCTLFFGGLTPLAVWQKLRANPTFVACVDTLLRANSPGFPLRGLWVTEQGFSKARARGQRTKHGLLSSYHPFPGPLE